MPIFFAITPKKKTHVSAAASIPGIGNLKRRSAAADPGGGAGAPTVLFIREREREKEKAREGGKTAKK